MCVCPERASTRPTTAPHFPAPLPETAMSSRQKAYDALVVAGTNALCAAGMTLRFEDVSEEQKCCLTMTDEPGHVARFQIDGVSCVAVSKPAGCGEERIAVVYDAVHPESALASVDCAGELPDGVTMAKCTLERKRGPYIMKERLGKWCFRAANAHRDALSGKVVQPEGYGVYGAFVM